MLDELLRDVRTAGGKRVLNQPEIVLLQAVFSNVQRFSVGSVTSYKSVVSTA